MPVVCFNFGDIAARQLGGEPSRRKILPDTDRLQQLSKSVGAKTFELPDGGFAARFSLGKFETYYGFENRDHATRAFEYLMQNRKVQARMEETATRAARTQTVEVPDEPVQWDQLSPTRQIDRLMHGEVQAMPTDPETYITGFLSPQSTAVQLGNVIPARVMLRRLGPEGQVLVEMFERMHNISDRTTGQAMVTLERALQNVPEEEIIEGIFRHAEEGLPLSDAGQRAWATLNTIADEQYNAARGMGVRVADKVDNYFPHVYNVARLADPEYEGNLKRALIERGVVATESEADEVLTHRAFGTSRNRAITHIQRSHKEAGRADMTRAEAEHVLDRFIKKNQTFISGHLERERLAAIPPITDVRKAYAIALSRNSRRVAEAQVLGPNYEKVYRLIDTIEDTHGQRAADMAKKLLDMEVGRVEKRVPEFMEGIFRWQAAKLSLAVLPNMTQTINVAIKAGLSAYVRGLLVSTQKDLLPSLFRGGAFTQAGRAKLREHVQMTGALANDMLDDIRFRGMDAMLPDDVRAQLASPTQKVIRKVEDFSLIAFNHVEAANRTISQRAGEIYFEDQVKRLAVNPADRLATLRLRELNINPETVVGLLQQGRTPNTAGLLDELKLLAGKRMSDLTQFRTSQVATRGLWAQHPLGRAMFQFKTFAAGQAEFMTREIFRQAKAKDFGRLAQTLGVLSVAMPGVGVALTKTRQGMMGDTLASDRVDAAFEDPTFMNILAGGIGAMASVGALGIMADVATTAYVGNKFALQSFFLFPMASTGINVLDIGASVGRGLFGQDVGEFERALRVASREFGGLGGVTTNILEEGEVIATPEQRRELAGGFGSF